MAKIMALMLLLLQVSFFFTVFGEELETLPPTSPSPHTSSPPLHPPTKSPSPVHPPAHPPHHHHRHHSPAPAPAPAPVHTPSSPPTHTSPVPTLPPKHHHHYPPASAPVHTPSSPPTHTSPVPTLPPKHHHHYPPASAPVKPPVHPPVVPAPAPAHPPMRPPVHPTPPMRPTPIPRSFIAVQGVVYLKSCKYAGVDTLLGATPLLGAVVKLQCNNTKYKLVQKDETDKNGYFFIEGPKNITTYGVHKCNVVLLTAPNGLKPSNLHGGITGTVLRPEKPFVSKGFPFMLYTVGPLAFEPRCPH